MKIRSSACSCFQIVSGAAVGNPSASALAINSGAEAPYSLALGEQLPRRQAEVPHQGTGDLGNGQVSEQLDKVGRDSAVLPGGLPSPTCVSSVCRLSSAQPSKTSVNFGPRPVLRHSSLLIRQRLIRQWEVERVSPIPLFSPVRQAGQLQPASRERIDKGFPYRISGGRNGESLLSKKFGNTARYELGKRWIVGVQDVRGRYIAPLLFPTLTIDRDRGLRE